MKEHHRECTGGRCAQRLAAGIAAAIACTALLCACDGRKSGWRQYTEVYRPPAPPAAGNAQPLAKEGGDESPAMKWTAPEGWTETKGSGGMRLATFDIAAGSSTGLCTIVLLGGNAGGQTANVARWIGQAGLAPLSEDEMKSFIEKQQTIKSDGGFEVFIADLTSLAKNDSANSMIASIVGFEGATCFVKLTGTAGMLKTQKDNFIRLCRSLTK